MSSGVPSRPSGTACASVSIDPGAADRGVAAASIGASITPGATQGTGLGTRVVTAMAANLQSKVEYDTGVEGTRASFRFRI